MAVVGPRSWVLTAVILVSTAALLGTSPEEEPEVLYTFEREGVEGGTVELTAEESVARFVVKLRAEDLGPDGVLTTENATARAHGSVRLLGDAAKEAAFVGVRLSGPADGGSSLQVLTRFDLSHGFAFSGNCSQPSEGTPCEAQLLLELSRLDEGANGGTVAVEWALDLSSRVAVRGEGNDVTEAPPWSVEVAGP